jgi:hypothetical protein
MAEQAEVQKRRGRPPGSKNKPKEAPAPPVEGDAMRTAFAVPDSVYAEKKPGETYAEIVETFFEKYGTTPGRMPDGTFLNVDAYVDRFDNDGNPLDLDFRWGSWGGTNPHKNKQAGFIPVRRNPVTRRIDPVNGEMVEVSGGPLQRDKMQLLVRKGEVSRMREQEKAAANRSRTDADRASRNEKIIDELGLKTVPKLVEHVLNITEE